jgi:hypothetical protein
MPRLDARQKVEEYGCGHYGCVMPTNEMSVVCKLTTDISEARFVAQAMLLPETEGIVEYKGIYALRGEERSVGYGHKRPMFILWRTEAFEVGALARRWMHGDAPAFIGNVGSYEYRVLREGVHLTQRFKAEAAVVRRFVGNRLREIERGREVRLGGSWGHAGQVVNREQLLSAVWDAYGRENYDYGETGKFGAPKSVIGLKRVGIAINNCEAVAQELENTQFVYLIGRALEFFLGEGLLLADVHLNNIGLSADNELIITDPGHVVEIHPRWATSVSVKEL